MPWLEFLVPALVLIVATPSVAIAYIYARSSRSNWSASLFGFLLSASGVSLLSAVGIFLRASGIGESFALYFVIWNLSFLILAVASWLAIETGLFAVGAPSVRGVRRIFAAGSVLSYVGALALALGAKDDLFFPYIGGTYAATSLYLFLSLAFALLIVLRGRARLAPENEATLRRFLRVFLPLCSLFFFDELSRASSLARLPWPPLLPLAPLALYVFSSIELLGRLRRSEDKPSSERAAAESRAALIAGACLASPLTLRERGVLIELLRGASNADIASRLGISPNTVKNHIYNIFQKTGAGSRSELLFLADRGPSSPDSQPLTIED